MELISREEALELMWNLVDGEYTDSDSANKDIQRQYKEMLNLSIIESRPKGRWIDRSEDGYVECPFCHEATTCDGNIEELHYCWNCGAELSYVEKLNELREGVNKSIIALENMRKLFMNLDAPTNIKYNFGEDDCEKIEELLSTLYNQETRLQYFIDKRN